ncbi:hypothetical protein [Glycomyces sp. NPDC021274]|uniref:hypothetical protein n=1 Tax=Glycomyces sp. NPDC021274 TaxID=3155120 RepID=UPI003404D18D
MDTTLSLSVKVSMCRGISVLWFPDSRDAAREVVVSEDRRKMTSTRLIVTSYMMSFGVVVLIATFDDIGR